MVRTSVTDTLNSDSIAALICGLVASRWTRNAYSLRAPYAADDFSVTTGRTMVACRSGIGRLLVRRAAFQRAELHHDRLRPEHFVRGRVGEPHDVHVGNVAAREVDVVRGGGVARRQHQDFLVACGP